MTKPGWPLCRPPADLATARLALGVVPRRQGGSTQCPSCRSVSPAAKRHAAYRVSVRAVRARAPRGNTRMERRREAGAGDRALPPRAWSRSASPLGALPPKTQGEAPTGGREGHRVLGPVWSMLTQRETLVPRPGFWAIPHAAAAQRKADRHAGQGGPRPARGRLGRPFTDPGGDGERRPGGLRGLRAAEAGSLNPIMLT